jgi:16S rRNA G966 N2-methylase RsmD
MEINYNHDTNTRKKPDPIINTALKRKLFPYLEENTLFKDLKIDYDSIYYITTRDASVEICNIIINYLRKMNIQSSELVITDMTAGVGGNTLLFGKYFKYINAIEIDYIRCSYLKHNVKVYGYDNINIYHGNCLDYVIKNDFLNQDIIFIDPPWGGKNYKSIDKINISIDEYTLEDICNHLIKNSLAKLIVLKLPKNYNFEQLESQISFPIEYYELKKMILVLIINHYK